MTAIVRLKELKETVFHVWSPTEEAAGVDSRFRRRLMNIPGFIQNCRPSTIQQIHTRVDRFLPFPLYPDYLRTARAELTRLKARPGSSELVVFIDVLEGFLNRAYAEDKVEALGLIYMRMMTCMSKGLHHGQRTDRFGGRSGWQLALQEAEGFAEEGMKFADSAMAVVSEAEGAKITHLRAFIFINWVQIIQEQAKENYMARNGIVRTMEAAKSTFHSKDAVNVLKDVVIKNPYVWQAAYNGIEIASTLDMDEEAKWFFEHLVKLDPGFRDFEYSPGEAKPISKERGMKRFVDKFREVLHVSNPIRKENVMKATVTLSLMTLLSTITQALAAIGTSV